jgi:hypothetical protein
MFHVRCFMFDLFFVFICLFLFRNSHSSYLLSLPNLSTYLQPLSQLVDSRVSVFRKLLKLQGRLDLVLSQVERIEQGKTQSPKTVFNGQQI